MCKQDVQALVEAAALNAIYAQQIKRVRELAEAFVTAGYQGEWTGVEIRAAILEALDGEK